MVNKAEQEARKAQQEADKEFNNQKEAETETLRKALSTDPEKTKGTTRSLIASELVAGTRNISTEPKNPEDEEESKPKKAVKEEEEPKKEEPKKSPESPYKYQVK